MTSPYVGEIRMFAGNFAPVGWALCQGQLIPISENETLYNLIGTTYGGDGQSTFALPDLRSRTPMHVGPNFVMGQLGGEESVTLTLSQIPQHNHSVPTSSQPGAVSTPSSSVILSDEGQSVANAVFTYVPYNGSNQVQLAPQAIGFTGGNQPHDNIQPYLTLNFIISLYGVYPTQN
jgi:microcystin-dependent protein